MTFRGLLRGPEPRRSGGRFHPAFKAGGGRRRPAGFTLMEVLVTVVVIAIGCLAVLWLQTAARQSNAQADHLTAATFLAESEIERLKSYSFEDATVLVEANSSSPTVQYLDRLGKSLPAGDPAALFTRTISYYPRRPTTLSHQVEVRIDWRDGSRNAWLAYTAALTNFSF